MQFKLTPLSSRVLLAAGLALGAVAAQAAGGATVLKSQESLITPGMSRAEVQQAIGRPGHDVKYGNEPGPTWTYGVASATGGVTLFDVDFGQDGKVAAVSERMEEIGR